MDIGQTGGSLSDQVARLRCVCEATLFNLVFHTFLFLAEHNTDCSQFLIIFVSWHGYLHRAEGPGGDMQ